ncbi:peptidoglycan D,D-transpeptidase FtsI family protein [Tenggerimyces flavus]|uniref:Peptidoglycan D,D-transpeptidase FtsI family protein n=1 Tax=Tenggerimyces flavus TaxID=1708749 RepID=A0ABV7YRD9_9ACTN|nr:penicillin-binding transpeptidase domain-containing protein [Tenggerimyces flavus]MBM7784414.1 peptidoglycan glycosyltransferase [Tenggerimyces flavus]
MNRPIRRIAIAFVVLFLVLLVNINYIQVIQAPDLNARSDNRRVLLDEYARQRGPILVGGRPVASSVATDDDLVYLRKYASPDLYGHLTGYYSFIYGRSGVEKVENSVLAGTDNRFFVRRLVDMLTNRPAQSGDVSLTINPRLQEIAHRELGDKKGSVVAYEPTTGKVLAMVSHPTWDPNKLSSHSAKEITANWKELLADKTKPMENRAIQRRYPPGSTFKLVTAAAALTSRKYNLETQIPGPAVLDLPQTSRNITNHDNRACKDGQVTLQEALEISCNTAFANVGLTLGADALREQAEKFGFGTRMFPELDGASSAFPAAGKIDKPQTAMSSIGQYDVAATPLQMAMVTGAIANRGKVMKPYLIDQVRGPDTLPLETTEPTELGQAVTPEVADQLKQMMVNVVDNGTGKPARIDGVSVGGKTGTAQTTPDRPPFAWFVSFAPADDPKVAVAVVIEEANVAPDDISGGKLAAPIAKALMEEVIGR